ncbi:MAG: hypothetical protein K5990_04400 [Oscillospiraceae bacterium]|nr:hypothetical protein [Oscillospiraceae bacterium]
MSSKSSVFNYLPIHLRGEIIEIGAVKLNDDWTPGEEFQIDVKPVYFRKMHFKVKKLTGIDGNRLSHAPGFVEAFRQFRDFCGEGCTFLTWGYDDKGILEQNIIVHDQDWDWIDGWVNLQLIYNMQTEGDKNQKALATAMEHFGIEQTRVAHDALGDAYNTGLVCSHLDMEAGLRHYAEAARQLSLRRQEREERALAEGPAPLEHLTFTGYASRNAAFADEGLRNLRCPVCGAPLSLQRWVNQGDKRYMTLGVCETHGSYLVRVKLKRTEEETWSVNRILYEADEGMQNFYKSKSSQRRRHARRRKKSGAAKSQS